MELALLTYVATQFLVHNTQMHITICMLVDVQQQHKHFLASSGIMMCFTISCASKIIQLSCNKFIPFTHTDLTTFTRVSNSPFTEQILQEKSFNTPTSREFMCSNATKFKWTAILTKIKRLFPNVLLCPHVCKASLNEVCIFSL